VAGLAAIGTANSMGARVHASDVRPEVGEQVESMGASFVPVPSLQEGSGDGYAKEMDADAAALARALYAEEAAKSDIVITTANIPGRRSPILLDEAAVAAMAPGSVIVDMAAANGGNCALTVPGEAITTGNGVTIIGYADLAERLPAQASQLYGRNLANLLALLTPDKDGRIDLDMNDEVIRGITVVAEGAIMWPPPPVQVCAAPAPARPEPTPEEIAAKAATERAERKRKKRLKTLGIATAVIALMALVLGTPAAATSHYIVLLLAVILGFYVISNVTPALHTPLMSVTNAISGIILVGAISQMGDPHPLVVAVSFAAIVLASVNIFGGFAITHRMLSMFRK
ncbi:Re/Si-specific NAD(P)(+) transhydrogenase subunit alpha, partial [Schaalia hyovaginalis]